MLIFLIGIAAILLFLVFIYLLGIIPNLWSNLITNPKCIETALGEGFSNFWKLFVICIILIVTYGIGLVIYNLIV